MKKVYLIFVWIFLLFNGFVFAGESKEQKAEEFLVKFYKSDTRVYFDKIDYIFFSKSLTNLIKISKEVEARCIEFVRGTTDKPYTLQEGDNFSGVFEGAESNFTIKSINCINDDCFVSVKQQYFEYDWMDVVHVNLKNNTPRLENIYFDRKNGTNLILFFLEYIEGEKNNCM
ncbi:MAG: hypothetical protein ACK5LP_00475 [Campylobacteraceae bacterium]